VQTLVFNLVENDIAGVHQTSASSFLEPQDLSLGSRRNHR
jgi:hypothetical protein